MKKRLLCPFLPKKGFPAPLSEAEAHHATRVLRLRDGDKVEAIDGKGGQSEAILRIRGGQPRLEYVESELDTRCLQQKAPPLPLTLEMSILKGDAMEWVIEKAVELGINRLVPLVTDFTVVQIKSKGPESFQERWQKIADQALKQCGRLDRLDVELPLPLEERLTHSKPNVHRLWCDEQGIENCPYIMNWLTTNLPAHSAAPQQEIQILIGPEGGWSPHERELFTQQSKLTPLHRVHLGPRILRAETAAIFTLSVASAHLYQMSIS